MEFKMHTYDIQHLIIALIASTGKTGFTEGEKQRLLSVLNGLNTLCTKDNDYTLTVKIEP
jgi:hypothetical protein